MKLVEIIVDVHEKESDLFEDICQRNIGECREEALKSGDVAVICGGYRIGWELKRNQDYTNSLQSGRLNNQLIELTRTYDFPILVVEAWHPYIGDNPSESEIARKVAVHEKSIRTLNRRVCTYETPDQARTIDLFEDAVKAIQSNKFQYLRRKIVIIDIDPRIELLARMPNVGVTRATELLELFGTPENAFANIDSWVEVNGITDGRLAEIKRIWSEEASKPC